MSSNVPTPAAKVWLVLAKCHRALSAYIEHSIAKHGLCLSDFMALEALLHKGPLTVSEIGSKILLTSGSMTAAIDRLEEKGLVKREPQGTDRRAKRITLTPPGKRFITKIFAAHCEDLESLMQNVSAEQRSVLRDALKTIGHAAVQASEHQEQAHRSEMKSKRKGAI